MKKKMLIALITGMTFVFVVHAFSLQPAKSSKGQENEFVPFKTKGNRSHQSSAVLTDSSNYFRRMERQKILPGNRQNELNNTDPPMPFNHGNWAVTNKRMR